MKKLDRNAAQEPTCLSTFTYPEKSWANVRSRHKQRIWVELDKIQNKFCAYCESPAERGEDLGHIEHFLHKGAVQYAHLSFSWPNLFGCCDSKLHCGHYKDQELPGGTPRPYTPELVIKPDVDEPEDYLMFLPSGVIKEKPGLSEEQKERATETIKALNLKAAKLIRSRQSQIKLYENRVLALMESVDELSLSQNEFDVQYLEIQSQSQLEAHRTAIRQTVF